MIFRATLDEVVQIFNGLNRRYGYGLELYGTRGARAAWIAGEHVIGAEHIGGETYLDWINPQYRRAPGDAPEGVPALIGQLARSFRPVKAPEEHTRWARWAIPPFVPDDDARAVSWRAEWERRERMTPQEIADEILDAPEIGRAEAGKEADQGEQRDTSSRQEYLFDGTLDEFWSAARCYYRQLAGGTPFGVFPEGYEEEFCARGYITLPNAHGSFCKAIHALPSLGGRVRVVVNFPDDSPQARDAWELLRAELLRRGWRVTQIGAIAPTTGDVVEQSGEARQLAGRKSDEGYDWAFEQIRQGMSTTDAYRAWAEKYPEKASELQDPSDSFKKAMRARRGKN